MVNSFLFKFVNLNSEDFYYYYSPVVTKKNSDDKMYLMFLVYEYVDKVGQAANEHISLPTSYLTYALGAVLVVMLCLGFAIRRARLLYLMAKIPGPTAFPLIGNAGPFLFLPRDGKYQ